MSKGRGFRGPRRRGFDDDAPFGGGGDDMGGSAARSPRPFEGGGGRAPFDGGARSFDRPGGARPGGGGSAIGMPAQAHVKWFNPEKGFGFAELADGAGDAFLHVSVLQAAGFDSVPPGAKLEVLVGQGQKGAQITQVNAVVTSAAADYVPPRPAGPRAGGFGGGGGGGGFGGPRPPRRAPDLSNAVTMAGTVKWFNNDKGFGFVASEDGGKDVFVHISVLGAAGLQSLPEGQPVRMQVVETPKGREAATIALSD